MGEHTELSDLRSSHIASLDEFEVDAENALFEELVALDNANNPNIVYCPICCKHCLDIEYLNNRQPVYSCLCGIKFQPRDNSVTNKGGKENDVEIGQRMLKCLKLNINSLMQYHCNKLHCNNQLNFAVIEKSGYLQAWCCRCSCNEIVI